MARIRTDNVFGTTTDAPLTAGATTLNSAGLANLAAVSGGDEAIITLDPNKVDGAPEIIRVTSHTGSATSATITRGQFGTTAREHAAGTEWVHGPIASDSTDFSDDADDQGDYVPLGEWQTYTPTLTAASSNPTLGTGSTAVGRYTRMGRLVRGGVDIVFGSSGVSAGSGIYRIGAPTITASASAVLSNGSGTIIDAGAPRPVSLQVNVAGGYFVMVSDAGYVAHNTPWTWAAGDEIHIDFTYEAAT